MEDGKIRELVEGYRNSTVTDKDLDNYRKKLLGTWGNRWFKIKRFFKRLIK